SDAARLERSPDPAHLVGNFLPSAPQRHSAKGYEMRCGGGRLPICFTDETTSLPNFASRSNNRNLWAAEYGHASRICCTIQKAVGFRVTLKRRILRRSWPMTKKQ